MDGDCGPACQVCLEFVDGSLYANLLLQFIGPSRYV